MRVDDYVMEGWFGKLLAVIEFTEHYSLVVVTLLVCDCEAYVSDGIPALRPSL
jgi:hypothetical protein